MTISLVPLWEVLVGRRQEARIVDTRERFESRGRAGLHEVIFYGAFAIWLCATVFATAASFHGFNWFRVSVIAFLVLFCNDVLLGTHTRRSLVLLCILAVCACNSYRINFSEFGMNLMVVYYARGLDFDRLIKRSLVLESACVLLVIAASCGGILNDVLVSRGDTMRHSLGFGYVTFLAHYYLNLVIAHFYVRRRSYRYVELLIAALVDIAIYRVTDTRGPFLLVMLVLVALACRRFLAARGIGHERLNRWIVRLVPASFVLCACVACALVLWIPVRSSLGARLNGDFSQRLELSQDAYLSYPLRPFGSEVHFSAWNDRGDGQVVSGYEEDGHFVRAKYSYVDSAYLQLPLVQGVIPYIVLMGLLALGCLWLAQQGNYLGLVLMVPFALRAILDPQLMMVHYCFLLFAMCRPVDGRRLGEAVLGPGHDGVVLVRGATIGVPVAACVLALVSSLLNRGIPVAIDERSFPDDALRVYVAQKLDTDGDGWLSRAEAARLTSLSVRDVRELSGLERFPNLESVDAGGDSLVKADLSGITSLSRVNLAGASNLSELDLAGDTNLRSLYVTGTALESIDLGSAQGLAVLSCDDSVEVSNAPTVNLTQISGLDAVTHDASGSLVGSSHVDVSYDEEGRVTSKSLSGERQMSEEYEYDDAGRITRAVIESDDSSISGTWEIRYEDASPDWHATCTNGSHIDQTFNEVGHPESLDIDVMGLDGQVTGQVSYSYDGYGLLSSMTVVDRSDSEDGETRSYSLRYDANGSLKELRAYDGSESYSYEGLREPMAQTKAGDTSYYEWYRSGSDAAAYWTVANRADGSVSRSAGSYRFDEDFGFPTWGSTTTDDGTTTTLSGSYHSFDMAVDVNQRSFEAVDFNNMVVPTFSTDYFLLEGDLSHVVENEAYQVASGQDSSRLYTGTVNYYDDDAFDSYDHEYDGVLSELGQSSNGDVRHAYYDIDGDESPEMLVSDGMGGVAKIYTLVQGTPWLCREAQEGEHLTLSSQGFLVVAKDGGQSLERYDGIGFDEMGTTDITTGGLRLSDLYPSLAGIEWRDQ